MFFYVDGSNLLGARRRAGMTAHGLGLLAVIDRYFMQHGGGAHVVFDGMDGRHPGELIKFSQRTVAEIPLPDDRDQRADRVLLSRLQSVRDFEATRLVTDDRGLARDATQIGIRVESCSTFLKRLQSGESNVTLCGHSEKERAARQIDNTEFLMLWTSRENAPEQGGQSSDQ